jgi:lipopolysaccharide export LptBFGC system permease protein LptF
MQNDMIVKVPTMQLVDFLQQINSQNLFLNSRIINAEDVTANIKMAQLEQQRMKKKEGNIDKLKPTSTTVEQGDDNERDHNQNIIDSYNLKDNIAYSTVNLSIKEPNVRVAEIAVTNTKSIDAKYKPTSFYEAKLSIINGFYLIQQSFILLLNLWPFALIVAGIIWFVRAKGVKRPKSPKPTVND